MAPQSVTDTVESVRTQLGVLLTAVTVVNARECWKCLVPFPMLARIILSSVKSIYRLLVSFYA